MIIGSDKLTEWIKANNCPYWRIMHSEKGGVIIQSDTKEGLTLPDSLLRLESALKMISYGNYFVDAWFQGLNQNSRFKTRFILPENELNPQINLTQQQVQPIVDVKEEITKALEDYKRTLEIERLRAENESYRKEVNSSTHRILNRVEPYLGEIIEGLFPNTKGKGSIGNQPQTTPTEQEEMINATEQEQQELEQALSNWSETDPELITLISKISKLANEDPDTYKMAKTMLMSK